MTNLMLRQAEFWSRSEMIPKKVSQTEIDLHHLKHARTQLDFWMYPTCPKKVRFVTAVRICQIEMKISELQGFPFPTDGLFGWEHTRGKGWSSNRTCNPRYKRIAKILDAPLIAVRAARAWMRHAETVGDQDFRFYDDPITGFADFRPFQRERR